MILLDGPHNKFFHEKLGHAKGVRPAVIYLPSIIDIGAIDGLLSYVYGVPVQELGINELNFEVFLNAAAYLQMDVKLLPELLGIVGNTKLEEWVLSHYELLSSIDEFWIDFTNDTIHKLCGALRPEAVLDSFFDWIYADKSNRRQFISKLVELAKLYGIYINANSGNIGYPESGEIKLEQLIGDYSRINLNRKRASINEPYDVVFELDYGTKLRAHQLILLDGPTKYEFFHEALAGKQGTTVTIQIPEGISTWSVDLLLSYIYGVPLSKIGVTKESLWSFLRAAAYLKMDIKVLPKLASIFKAQDFGNYIPLNFTRLSQSSDFWKMDNMTIHKLCSTLSLETIEDAFLTWIHKNKTQRKFYLAKLLDLRQTRCWFEVNVKTEEQERSDPTTSTKDDNADMSTGSVNNFDSGSDSRRKDFRTQKPFLKRLRISAESFWD